MYAVLNFAVFTVTLCFKTGLFYNLHESQALDVNTVTFMLDSCLESMYAPPVCTKKR